LFFNEARLSAVAVPPPTATADSVLAYMYVTGLVRYPA